jgi:hypothetical protein
MTILWERHLLRMLLKATGFGSFVIDISPCFLKGSLFDELADSNFPGSEIRSLWTGECFFEDCLSPCFVKIRLLPRHSAFSILIIRNEEEGPF